MYSRQQFTDLTYMGGTGPCKPMTIIVGSVIKSEYISLSNKFGVNRAFHVLKAPVYRFELHGRYQILWTDIAIDLFKFYCHSKTNQKIVFFKRLKFFVIAKI